MLFRTIQESVKQQVNLLTRTLSGSGILNDAMITIKNWLISIR